jgi:lysophospholipase L1-like esterase
MKHVPLALMLCLAPLCAQTAAPTKATTLVPVTQDRDKAVYDWAKRHQEVMELGKRGAVDVVMLGDSILHYWAGEPKAPIVRGEAAWSELFKEKKAANLGFGWDRVENVLWRVENGELDGLKPKKVVMLIGTNNLEFNTVEEIRMGIEHLCRSIHKKSPATDIHVLGILPRRLPAKVMANPDQVNAELHKHLAGEERIHFHDISGVFLDEDGSLNGQLFSDGLHPNAAGYERMGAAIRQVIAR